jgi:hypothetical protein
MATGIIGAVDDDIAIGALDPVEVAKMPVFEARQPLPRVRFHTLAQSRNKSTKTQKQVIGKPCK